MVVRRGRFIWHKTDRARTRPPQISKRLALASPSPPPPRPSSPPAIPRDPPPRDGDLSTPPYASSCVLLCLWRTLSGRLYSRNWACDARARRGAGAASEGGCRSGSATDLYGDFLGHLLGLVVLQEFGYCRLLFKMVCMSGHFKMASVLKLVMTENHAAPDDVINEKSASHILHKQFFDAYEPNLLDEDDMHIFGSKPMADPLDLVRCNTCKKPVKASQYAPHAECCSSGKANPKDSMGVDDDACPKKPPKKGRKIKLTSNGNQKVHIKVNANSQSENKNIVNDFPLNNGNAFKLQPSDSAINQRLKTSTDNAAITNAHESHFRDVPAPLATKMYHSQGNYRLRLELGQLFRESCAEQSSSYSNTTLNSSQDNGLVPCDTSALHGAEKSFASQEKHLDQRLVSTSEVCSGIPQHSSASGPNRLQATKSHKADTRESAVRNELARSGGNKAAVPSSKCTGKKKAQQQSKALLR